VLAARDPRARGILGTEVRPVRGHVARVETRVEAPPERVWQVLTDPEPRPEVMFGARTVTEWQVGGPIRWQGEWEGRVFEDKGEVLVVDPPRRLVVTHWSPLGGRPDEPDAYHEMAFLLEPADGGTRVELTQDNNPTPEAAEHSRAMWASMLEGVRALSEAG